MIYLFFYHFGKVCISLGSIFLLFTGLIVAGAFYISYAEQIPIKHALYFAFITGLTIGYRDIVPVSDGGKLVAILLGLVGVLFSGITVAAAVYAIQNARADLYPDEILFSRLLSSPAAVRTAKSFLVLSPD